MNIVIGADGRQTIVNIVIGDDGWRTSVHHDGSLVLRQGTDEIHVSCADMRGWLQLIAEVTEAAAWAQDHHDGAAKLRAVRSRVNPEWCDGFEAGLV